MRLTPVLAGILTTGAVALAVPATGGASLLPTGGSCATGSAFARVTDGQTLAQVQQEMGSAGAPNGGMVVDNGFTTYDPTWQNCSLGLIQYGVDFHANPGQPLTVVGKSAL